MLQDDAQRPVEGPGPIRRLDAVFIEHPAFVDTLSDLLFELGLQGEVDEPPCFYVTGPTGIGKSTLIAALLEHYPRESDAIRRAMPDGTVKVSDRIPMVAVKMRPQPTGNGLLRSLLQELGDPLWKSGEREELQHRLAVLGEACETRTVIVDEAQRAVDRDGVLRRFDIADVLKDINERMGVTVLLFGMGRTRILLDHDSQVWRKFEDEIRVPPFEWGADQPNGMPACRAAFIGLLVTYREQMPVPFSKSVDVENQEVAQRFFYVSRGVLGLLKKLLLRAVKIALRDGRSAEITELILYEAFQRAFHKDRTVDVLINPWGPDWDRRLPPPLVHDAELPKKKPKRKGAARGKRKSDRKAEVLRALSLS